MRYRIKGAIRGTGEEIEVDIAAASDADAIATASRLDLLAESIKRIIETKPKTIAACQACGLVIEPHGVLRVVGEKCLCPDCYRKHVVDSNETQPRWTKEFLDSLYVKVNYDEFEDVTHASMESRSHYSCVRITASFPGKVQATPIDGVQICLSFQNHLEQKFPKRLQTELILLFDGKRVPVTVDEWLKKSFREDGTTYYEEEVCFRVMQPLLSELLCATEVRGKLVNEQLDLTRLSHNGIGALAQVVKFKDLGERVHDKDIPLHTVSNKPSVSDRIDPEKGS